jgi:hypothetical protein
MSNKTHYQVINNSHFTGWRIGTVVVIHTDVSSADSVLASLPQGGPALWVHRDEIAPVS